MSKVYNYMIIATGLILLMKLAGLPCGADGFMAFISGNDISNISNSLFFAGIYYVFTIGLVGTLIIGFFYKAPVESILICAVAGGIFTTLISSLVSVIIYASDFGYISYIISLILIPLTVAFGVSIINFWRGSDF